MAGRAEAQVYNIKQAKRDIDAVYSMGLFDDVNILPSPAEDTTLENPKARPTPYDLTASCAHRTSGVGGDEHQTSTK